MKEIRSAGAVAQVAAGLTRVLAAAGRRPGLILLGCVALAWGQPAPVRADVIGRAQAQEIARQMGWIVRQETPFGVIELQAIVDGVPKYYMTTNADAADSISTDECLPGGSSGLGLTG